MEVKDDTRDDSDGLLGENAKTCKSAAANTTRPALKSMVLEGWFFSSGKVDAL